MTNEELIRQAIALHRRGDLAEAGMMYRRALELNPNDATAIHLLGAIYHQQKEHRKAEELYRKAVLLEPRYLQAWANLGILLQDQGRWMDAVECFRAAVALDPSSVATWSAMGRVFGKLGDLAGAEDAYRQAILHDPRDAEAYNNLGTILARRGEPESARSAFTNALELRPGFVSPLTNNAKLLRNEGRLDDAEALYREALSIEPNSAAAHWGLADVLLLRGDLPDGWEEYEWRWALDEPPVAPNRNEPRWMGEPCEGKRIILFAEQGLGDAIQFVRYVPLVAGRGGRVTLLVPQPLVRLFKGIPGVDNVVSVDSPGIVGDMQCSLLSLPRIFRTTIASIPASVPYLRVQDSLRESWRARCTRNTGRINVGVAWAGSGTHENDARRSIGPALLQELSGSPGVEFYSLQVGRASLHDQSDETRSGLIDYSELLSDVAETAGLIEQMDLVITVDTMVAHLAGALAKPVWVLLPSSPDWRWLLDRETSPWYPTARLIRQTGEGEWGDVIRKVKHMLTTEVHAQSNSSPNLSVPSADLEAAIRAHENGHVEEAEKQYRDALQSDPYNPEARYLLAVARYQQQDYREAIVLGRQLIQTHPFFPEAYSTLGNSLRKSGDLIGAEDVLRKAITLRPDFTDAHYNLGGCLCDAWRLEEAADEFLMTLRLDPHYARALNNLGLVRYRQGRIGEAAQYLRSALGADPAMTEAHWNLSHALLHTGEYGEGWREFEWRWRMPDFKNLAGRFQRPRWQGEDLHGKRLLVWAEQGFGDVLQFSRILPALRERCSEVIFECQVVLRPVCETLPGITIIGRGEKIPDHDFQIPLLSLPSVLGWQSVPEVPVPYLRPDAKAVDRWKEKLVTAGNRLRVGIAWSGSTTNPEGRFRSVPETMLAKLGQTDDIFFVNLQKDEASSAFRRFPFGPGGGDWTESLVDFGETAALVSQLDLVITIDTAVAHLAGALGKQVWLMLATPHDWRWGAGGRATAWYPTVRLYRQERHGEWGPVVEAVKHDLILLATQVRVPWEVREDPGVRKHLNAFDPVSFASWNNLGVALLDAGRPQAAVAPLEQAVALEPENSRAHLNLAFAQLVDGFWREGLENYEWRLRAEEGQSSQRPYPQPRWMGQPVRGKNLFLYAEQGFGDAIQCIRYAWLFAQSGARVTVEVRPPLVRLIQRAPGVSTVIVRGEEPPPFDYHSPLLSLPYAFRTTPSTVPARVPYLIAGHQQLLTWKQLLDTAGPGVRIGVCWSGNDRFIYDADRSISSETLFGELASFDATFVPLVLSQTPVKHPPSVTRNRWCDLTSRIEDFADTAALLTYVDLVVTVDTAVAHLAGALGKPVFMLVPFAPDWRWLSTGDTSPWYPTMRIFRQTERKSWSQPLSNLRAAVGEFINKKQESPPVPDNNMWETNG
jgi:Tfp pilus assembly protein PilF/ADP-heptose:LPS heptosyltransferase